MLVCIVSELFSFVFFWPDDGRVGNKIADWTWGEGSRGGKQGTIQHAIIQKGDSNSLFSNKKQPNISMKSFS